MRILFSGEDFYPFKGGADISVFTLFEELKKNHEVEAICVGEKTESIEYRGIKIYQIKSFYSQLSSWVKRYFLNKKWLKILDQHLKERKYDLIITQLTLTPASVKMAKKYNIPVLIFVRGMEHFCLSHFRDFKRLEKHSCFKYSSWKYKIQYIFFRKVIKWHGDAFKRADFIIANSRFIQKLIKKWYDIDSSVIYPFIKLKDYKTKKKSPKYITLIRPEIHKGVEIFLKISDELPNKKFLAVGSSEKANELMKKKNIKYIPWTGNMKKVYTQTKIILIPTILPESFGRMTVEGMINGIPCIATNMGGLLEAIGDSGIIIDDYSDIRKWVNAINKLNNKEFYSKLSKKAVKQAEKFDFKKQYKKFKKIIESLTKQNEM